ncbi:MAG: hypothetical protein K2Z81_27590, partial [Cyanobacteria bacterium]|nr:hypothetical protein [Cyanobacteriota bacterium]
MSILSGKAPDKSEVSMVAGVVRFPHKACLVLSSLSILAGQFSLDAWALENVARKSSDKRGASSSVRRRIATGSTKGAGSKRLLADKTESSAKAAIRLPR